jgi:mannose-6-phosphate isomerase-like protein (cupin superfamily)
MSQMDGKLFERRALTRVPKPWGHELIWAQTDRYVGKILHVNRGEVLSLQYHEMKDETLFVVRGRVKLSLRMGEESSELELMEGQAFHVPPGLIHRLEALEDSDVAEVSTPELDDVVRLEDRYGRAGTSDR